MKLTADKDKVIFTPESNFDCFVFGKVVGHNNKMSFTMNTKDSVITSFSIMLTDLWSFLILEQFKA